MKNLLKLAREYITIKRSGLFDCNYYLLQYPDVRAKDIDPLWHYILFGARELKKPSRYFCSLYYLNKNLDVKDSKINPLYHYIRFGAKENRDPSDRFSTRFYLEAYQDVASQGLNPLYHYTFFGEREGRLALPKSNLVSYKLCNRDKINNDTNKKRILFYYHNNKHNLLSDYVFSSLSSMGEVFSNIVFISGSIIKPSDKKELSRYCERLLIIDNIDSEYRAWREAILELGIETVSAYDSVTFMSDKIFGPVSDLVSVYKDMELDSTPFWGDAEVERSSKNIKSIGDFFVFGKAALKSREFTEYWSSNDLIHDRVNVIKNNILSKFSNFEYVKIPDVVDGSKVTRSFISVDSFLNSKHPKFYLKTIRDCYGDVYDMGLIEQHFNSVLEPNHSSEIYCKNILVDENRHNIKFRVAVHIHVFYVDVLDRILTSLQGREYLDIYITTNDSTKKQAIDKVLNRRGLLSSNSNVYVFENKGRDILPWVKISNKLQKYEVVGHFHTKKSNFYNEDWFGNSWMDEIIETIVAPIDSIMCEFNSNKKLGIVIPEMPFFFKFKMRACPFDGSSGKNRNNAQELWRRLDTAKECDFNHLTTPIMPYGTMFWYRPDALHRLTSFSGLEGETPSEPLGRDGTILHAIERLPVYLAWSEGYDYRVAITKESITSGFDYKSNN